MVLRSHVLSLILNAFLLATVLLSLVPLVTNAQTGSATVLSMLGGNCPGGWEAQAVERAARKWVSLGMYIPEHWVYASVESPDPGSPSQMVFYEFSDIGCRSLPACTITASAQTVSPGSPVTISWSKTASRITSAGNPMGNNFNYALGTVATSISIPGYINAVGSGQDISDSFVVYPQQTTTYTGTVRSGQTSSLYPDDSWNSEGTCSVTVNVGSTPPPCADREYELACSDPRTAPYRAANATQGTIKFSHYTNSSGGACNGAQPVVTENGCIAPEPDRSVEVSCSGPDTASLGQSATRTATARGGTGTYTYSWSASGGTPATGANSSFTTSYSTTGVKSATVTVTDSSGKSDTATCPALTVDSGCANRTYTNISCSHPGLDPYRAYLGIPANATQGTISYTIYSTAAGNVCDGAMPTGVTHTCTVPQGPQCTGTRPLNTVVYSGDEPPTTNTAWSYSEANTSARCQYACASGYTYQNGSCVASPAFTCTGTVPSNANLCTGDDTGLSANTARTVTSSCSTPSGSVPKCQYTCASGYTLSGTSCVPQTGFGAPTNFTAVAGSCGTNQIVLNWTGVQGATAYTVHRSTNPTFLPSATAVYSGNGTSYTDTGLNPGTQYYYRVRASGSSGNSDWSGTARQIVAGACASKPDLVSQNFGVGGSGPYVVNTGISISAQVRNAGTVSTGRGFSDNFTYRWGTTGSWQSFSGSVVSKTTLAANASSNDSATFTPTQTGSLYVQHCVDSTNVIDEGANEEPNCVQIGPLTVAASACVPNINSPCTSSANSCGMTAPGTIQCNGSCSASTPSNALCQPKCNGTIISNCQVSSNTSLFQESGICTNGTTGSCKYRCVSPSAGGAVSNQWQPVSSNPLSNTCAVTPTPTGPPSISTNKPVVPSCGMVTLIPETNGHENCTISGGGFTNVPVAEFDPDISICANTTFTITCGELTDSVTVEVLGAGFET